MPDSARKNSVLSFLVKVSRVGWALSAFLPLVLILLRPRSGESNQHPVSGLRLAATKWSPAGPRRDPAVGPEHAVTLPSPPSLHRAIYSQLLCSWHCCTMAIYSFSLAKFEAFASKPSARAVGQRSKLDPTCNPPRDTRGPSHRVPADVMGDLKLNKRQTHDSEVMQAKETGLMVQTRTPPYLSDTHNQTARSEPQENLSVQRCS